jgi:hypothetical protein
MTEQPRETPSGVGPESSPTGAPIDETQPHQVPVTSPPVADAPDEGPIVAPAHAVQRDTGAAGTAPEGPGRSTAVRWAIALGGLAVVLAVSAIIVLLAGGRPNPSMMVGYMPNDTVQYAEYRFDLPGDQRQKLAAFLSKFPGFADQSAVEPKLYEVLDRILGEATKHTQTYTGDIKPWFGGQIAMGSSAGSLGAIGAGTAAASSLGGALFVVTVSDAPKATAWVEKVLGPSASKSPYGGTTIYTSQDGVSGFVMAVTDKVLLAGSDAAVRAAIDSKGQNKLGDDAQFKAAFGTVTRDYVGFSYTEWRGYLQSLIALVGPASGLANTTVDEELLNLVPEWQANVLRFEDDALVGDSTYPSIDVGFKASNRKSVLVGHAPPATILYSEAHDVGKAITSILDRFRQMPDLRQGFAQFDQAIGRFGGLDALIGWIGDAAVVVSPNADGSIGGGLLVTPTNPDTAKRTFESVRSLLVLAGGGSGIKVTDEQHGDATITVIDFSAAVGPGGLPPGVKAEIAYAVTNDLVVIGYGKSFVTAVLDAGPGPSFADTERYKSLVARVGEDNIGLSVVDVQAIRTLVEPLVQKAIPADKWAFYAREIQPYVSHFDALVSGARADGDLDRLPMSLVVK